MEPPCRSIRGTIRVARGDLEGGLRDTAEALEHARAITDPQMLYPALGQHAASLALGGAMEDASAVAEELLGEWRREPWKYLPGDWVAPLATTLGELGRGGDFLEAAQGVRTPHPVARCRRVGRGGSVRRRSRCLRRHGVASRTRPTRGSIPEASPRSGARSTSTARSAPPATSIRARLCSPRRHEHARRERKVVTVLFADLVGFTSRAESLDPEDVEAILGPYHERLRSELERFGGTVEKFIGDAVMALFGAPSAHEDDPERAVRAALAIRDWAEQEGELEVRIGITTGEALVSLDARPETGQGMASGDVVNTAARLQAAAPVNGILVDETTYRATERAISFEHAGPVEAKGKSEPVRVYAAIETRARFGVDVTVDVETPLVGRDRELDLLVDALARARTEREPQLVTLVGVPGIGKSRLVYELSRVVDADPELIAWRQGRSLPYGEGVTFWSIGEMAKAQAGILESDPAETAAEKLEHAVRTVLEDDRDAEWVAAPAPAAGRSRRRRRAHRRPPQRGLCRLAPLLRGDRRAGPARPRIRGPAVGGRRRPRLHRPPARMVERPSAARRRDRSARAARAPSGLGRREAERRHRAGWRRCPSTTRRGSSRRCSSRRSCRRRPSRRCSRAREAIRSTRRNSPGCSPTAACCAATAARSRSRRTATSRCPSRSRGSSPRGWTCSRSRRRSSSRTRRCSEGRLERRSGDDLQRPRAAVEECLHALRRKDFLRHERRSAVAGETQFTFLHLLTRDVAYGQIPRAARADKHRWAAEWLESLPGRPGRGPGRDDRAPLPRRPRARAERGAGHGELSEQARRALHEAGERALALNAFDPALQFFYGARSSSGRRRPGAARMCSIA